MCRAVSVRLAHRGRPGERVAHGVRRRHDSARQNRPLANAATPPLVGTTAITGCSARRSLQNM